MAYVCAGCQQPIPGREYLNCVLCAKKYDLECANVASVRFYNTMSSEQKENWKCQSCICKMPKKGNTETPVRIRDREDDGKVSPQSGCDNITLRKRKVNSSDASSSEDISLILGDTIDNINNTSSKIDQPIEITLQLLSQMIAVQLKENNKYIIAEIQNTIQIEIDTAVTKLREDINQKTDSLFAENNERKHDIDQITKKMENLEKENNKLIWEIKELEKKVRRSTEPQIPENNNNKKIVLHGLAEYFKEPEHNLHARIIDIFRDILQVDLLGYIEETNRIGKYKNNNRPLSIELISKRMTKYIVANSHYFHGTGLSVTEYLDERARKERKALREEMFTARRQGLHAIIRNSELYIEGQKIDHGHNTSNQQSLFSENKNANYQKGNNNYKNVPPNMNDQKINNRFRNRSTI